MIYWELFVVFFKIGLFSFGGGLAMIAVIGQEVTSRGWLTAAEYAQIITISQMTPGPIAVNTATYVGAKVCATTSGTMLLGSLIATLGVALPSLLLVLCLAGSLHKFKNAPAVQWILCGIRPAVIGFMLSAVLIFFQLTCFPACKQQLFDPYGAVLILVLFYLQHYQKMSPIPLMLLAGSCGLLLY
ncbi:MAG: chromate transporter [Acidaminococcaceae bacterium]